MKRFYGPALFLTVFCQGSPLLARDALRDGQWLADMRTRYEFVQQDGTDRDAHANTLRLRGGYKTGSFHGFSALAELELITHIGAPRFDDGVEGRTAYPEVGDPDDEAVNRLFLNYDNGEGSGFTLGRFRLAFDNERFIGRADFRQNDMTYDGVTVTHAPLDGLRLDYAYINQVNRPSGTHADTGKFEGDIHLLHAAYDIAPQASLAAYGYLLGLEDHAVTLASQTYGLRLDGRYPLEGPALLYTLEVAVQRDYAGNPIDYEATYYHISPGIAYGPASYRLGYEVLGGDEALSFRTPLSAAYGHNGWADMLNAPPPEGLRDLYASIDFRPPALEGTRISMQVHDYASERGGIHYGHEWGAGIERQLTPRWAVGARYADYHADRFGVDTVKGWLYAQFTY